MPALLITIVGSIIGLGAASLSFDLSPLGNWFVSASSWLLALMYKCFSTFGLYFQDWFCWVLDSVLRMVVYVLGGVCQFCGIGAIFSGGSQSGVNASSYFSGLPSALLGFANAIGLRQAIDFLGCSYGIRFILQTIPFVRWGS